MTDFTAANGKAYARCDTCQAIRAERDTRIPDCNFGTTTKLRTSSQPQSRGQKFRNCGKPVSAEGRCANFLVWA